MTKISFHHWMTKMTKELNFCINHLKTWRSTKREKEFLCSLFMVIQKIIIDFIKNYQINYLTFNRDYESYALKRDNDVTKMVSNLGLDSESFKDHVVFEGHEIYTANGKPYLFFHPSEIIG